MRGAAWRYFSEAQSSNNKRRDDGPDGALRDLQMTSGRTAGVRQLQWPGWPVARGWPRWLWWLVDGWVVLQCCSAPTRHLATFPDAGARPSTEREGRNLTPISSPSLNRQDCTIVFPPFTETEPLRAFRLLALLTWRYKSLFYSRSNLELSTETHRLSFDTAVLQGVT